MRSPWPCGARKPNASGTSSGSSNTIATTATGAVGMSRKRSPSSPSASAAAFGAGTVHSFVIMHHPPIPGYDYPLPVVLVDLEEGIRLVSNIIDCKHEDIHIGMRVECVIENVDDELKLPLFRPAK